MAYEQALLREINLTADLLGEGFAADSLYVGGGTPTLCMDTLSAAIPLARHRLGLRGNVCVETGPDACDAETLSTLRELDVNKISVGIQSFDNNLLKQMQRYEKYGSGEQILKRIDSIAGLSSTRSEDLWLGRRSGRCQEDGESRSGTSTACFR